MDHFQRPNVFRLYIFLDLQCFLTRSLPRTAASSKRRHYRVLSGGEGAGMSKDDRDTTVRPVVAAT